MDDALKPNEEMLITLAAELGLMSMVTSGAETVKPAETKPPSTSAATLT